MTDRLEAIRENFASHENWDWLLPVVEAADELARYCRLVDPEYGDVHAALTAYHRIREGK